MKATYKSKTRKEIISGIAKARYLIVVKGYTSKEVSSIIGFSENSISKWIHKYKWNAYPAKEIQGMGGINAVMERFFKDLEIKTPRVAMLVRKAWYSHLRKMIQNSSES